MSVQIGRTTFVGEEKKCKLTGQVFYSYLGIPYAKPPIGDLRFQVRIRHKWSRRSIFRHCICHIRKAMS